VRGKKKGFSKLSGKKKKREKVCSVSREERKGRDDVPGASGLDNREGGRGKTGENAKPGQKEPPSVKEEKFCLSPGGAGGGSVQG